MGGKGLGPTAAAAVFKDTGHHGLLELGIVDEGQRSLGIGEVHGVHTAIGIVLLAEPQEIAVLVGKELVSGNHMAVGSREHLGIFLSARLHAIVIDGAVPLAATLHVLGIEVLHLLEGLCDGDLASMCPVALVALIHILDVPHLVVAHHRVAAGRLGLAEVVDICQIHHISRFAGYNLPGTICRQLAILQEGLLGGEHLAKRHLTVHIREVEVAPVDAHAVTLAGKDGLVDGAGADCTEAVLVHIAAHRGLRLLVDGQLLGGIHIELHAVRLAVVAGHLGGDVVDGHAQHVVVVHEHGSREDHGEVHGAAGEGVVGVAGQHIHALLLGHLHIGNLWLHVAEKPEVDIAATRGVVAMGGNHIVAGLKQVLEVTLQMQLLAVDPGESCVHHFGAIDKEFEDIVVGIAHIEVGLQVFGRKVDMAAHIDIGVLAGPFCAYISLAPVTEGSLATLPTAVVERRAFPAGSRRLAGEGSLPTLLICHGGNGLQHTLLTGTHETIGLTIDTQQAIERFLVACPMGGGGGIELVGCRPDAQIGVVHNERHSRQTEVGGRIRFEEVVGLRSSASNGHQGT